MFWREAGGGGWRERGEGAACRAGKDSVSAEYEVRWEGRREAAIGKETGRRARERTGVWVIEERVRIVDEC